MTELPPIEAHITEEQSPQVVCPACGKTTQAPLPEDVAGEFGPQLTALFVHHDKFFVFVHHDGVEPTNARAERALRAAVQRRKIMFGNRSTGGEVAVARLLTVTRTCEMQQLNALAYLTAAIHAHRRHIVASLLPRRS